MLRRRIPLEGRHRPPRVPEKDDQHPLGRRDRGQLLRHARILRALPPDRVRGLRDRERRIRIRAGDERMGRVHDLRRRLPHGRPQKRERQRKAVEAEILRRGQRELGMRRQHERGVLRRPVPPLRHLCADLRPEEPGDEDRLRPERLGLQLDGRSHGARRTDDGRAFPPLLHRHRRLGTQGQGARVHRRGILA